MKAFLILYTSLLSIPYAWSQRSIQDFVHGELKCTSSLLDNLTNSAFIATSFVKPQSSNFDQNQSFDLTKVDTDQPDYSAVSIRYKRTASQSAWCPSNDIGDDLVEYVEIDLGSLHLISSIQLRGLTNKFARWIQIRYKRESSEREDWRIYRDGTESILQGQDKDRLPKVINIQNRFSARWIRFYPYNKLGMGKSTTCISIALYGCAHQERLIEYSASPGDYYVNESSYEKLTGLGALNDSFYDGYLDNFGDKSVPFLVQGLGKLADYKIGPEKILPKSELISEIKSTFIGWNKNSYKQKYVKINFRFAEIMNFTRISFFFLASIDSKQKLQFALPESVEMEFNYQIELEKVIEPNVNIKKYLSSKTSQTLSSETLVTKLDPLNLKIMMFSIEAGFNCASQVVLKIYFSSSSWIGLSEVIFDNDLANVNVLRQEHNKITGKASSHVTDKPTSTIEIENKDERPKENIESKSWLSYFFSSASTGTIAAAFIIIILLSLFVLTLILFLTFSCYWLIRRNRLRKHRSLRRKLNPKLPSSNECEQNITAGLNLPFTTNSNSTPKSGSSVLEENHNGSVGSSIRRGPTDTAPKNDKLSDSAMDLHNYHQIRRDSDLESLSTVSMAQDFLMFMRRIFYPHKWRLLRKKQSPGKNWDSKQNQMLLNSTNGFFYSPNSLPYNGNITPRLNHHNLDAQRLHFEALQQINYPNGFNTVQRPSFTEVPVGVPITSANSVQTVDGLVKIDFKNTNAPMLLNGHGMLPFQTSSINTPSTPIPGGQIIPSATSLYQQHQQHQLFLTLLAAQHRNQQLQSTLPMINDTSNNQIPTSSNIYNDPSVDDLETNMSPEYASAGSLFNSPAYLRGPSSIGGVIPPSPPPNHPSSRPFQSNMIDPNLAAMMLANPNLFTQTLQWLPASNIPVQPMPSSGFYNPQIQSQNFRQDSYHTVANESGIFDMNSSDSGMRKPL